MESAVNSSPDFGAVCWQGMRLCPVCGKPAKIGNGICFWRLHAGNVTVDDVYKVLPFQDAFFHVDLLTGVVLKALLKVLNMDDSYISTDPDPPPSKLFDAIFVTFVRRFGSQYLDLSFHISVYEVVSRNRCLLPHTYCYLTEGGMRHNGEQDVPSVTAALSKLTSTRIVPLPFQPNAQTPSTDTDMFLQWAGSSLGAPCSSS